MTTSKKSISILLFFLLSTNFIFCQVKNELPVSNTADFFMHAYSETQVYISNFDFNLIFNPLTRKVVGVFLKEYKIDFTNRNPLVFYNNGKITYFFNHYYPDLWMYNLVANTRTQIPLIPDVYTAFKAYRQWDDNSAFLLLCDRVTSLSHLFRADKNGNLFHQVSSVQTPCSWSMEIIVIDSTTVMTMNYLYNNKVTRVLLWKITDTEMTMLSSHDINLMKNSQAGYCKTVRLSQNTITECCCIVDCSRLVCQQLDLYPNEYVHPYSNEILNNCID